MTGTCTIVIPTYNEEKNIVNMAKAIRASYPDFHILFMDDNSTDNGKELIDGLNDPLTKVFVRKPEERGLAASVLQGFVISETDYFICMDCDFQHPVSALAGIYEKLENGADLCVGTRNNRKALGFYRWAGSWAFNVFCSASLKLHGKQTTSDLMSGLFGGRHDIFAPEIEKNWNSMELTGWKVLMDLFKYSDKRLKIEKSFYDFGTRAEGESHINSKVVITSWHQCWGFGKWCARRFAKLKHIDYYSMYPKEKK